MFLKVVIYRNVAFIHSNMPLAWVWAFNDAERNEAKYFFKGYLILILFTTNIYLVKIYSDFYFKYCSPLVIEWWFSENRVNVKGLLCYTRLGHVTLP